MLTINGYPAQTITVERGEDGVVSVMARAAEGAGTSGVQKMLARENLGFRDLLALGDILAIILDDAYHIVTDTEVFTLARMSTPLGFPSGIGIEVTSVGERDAELWLFKGETQLDQIRFHDRTIAVKVAEMARDVLRHADGYAEDADGNPDALFEVQFRLNAAAQSAG